MKIVHIITGLGKGGAEGTLTRLLHSSNKSSEHIVVSLTGTGFYTKALQDLDIKILHLNLKKPSTILSAITQLKDVIDSDTDVVHCWMYHSCFFGGVLAKMMGVKNIIWGIRHFDLSWKHNSFSALLAEFLCRVTANSVPTNIIYCANSSYEVHQKRGYPSNISHLIYNGHRAVFDHDVISLRRQFRSEQCFDESQLLIGMAGRWDKQKDHSNLIEAMSILKKCNNIAFTCLLAGTNMTRHNVELCSMLSAHGLEGNVVLLGQVADPISFFAGLDIHILSSLGEAFPNVLPEAITCRTFCVTTDVGDASIIMGGNGIVVEKQNSKSLSKAITQAIVLKNTDEQWEYNLGVAKKDIDYRFSFKKMLVAYNDLWGSLS